MALFGDKLEFQISEYGQSPSVKGKSCRQSVSFPKDELSKLRRLGSRRSVPSRSYAPYPEEGYVLETEVQNRGRAA